MGITGRIVNALYRRGGDMVRPRPGQVVEPTALDRWRAYPADGLTPSRLAAILRSADEGAPDEAMALFEQMEEKDAHLYSIAHTRRLALTSLRWQVVSAADVHDGVDRVLANEAAEYCGMVLRELDRLDEVLQHLSLAMGRNIAVAENVWEAVGPELRLMDMVPVTFDRLTFDEAGRLRIRTKEEPRQGIERSPCKFVVHTPHTVSGHPMRGGLLRVSALGYLGKHFAMKDWMVFAEVFGMPVRVARYDPSATPEEKRELLSMLQSLGSDASGIFSRAVELQLLEFGHGKAPPPYENMCNFFNRELSKAWLGATLAVDAADGSGGRYSRGPEVHNEVRLDLRQNDIVCEARTIRRDVLSPMARMRFGPAVPIPFFQRQLDLPRDRKALADVLDRAVNELGMRIPVRWAHKALGVPAAGEGEEILQGTAGGRG